MAYVEQPAADDDVAGVPRLLFLYRLRDGLAPTSFGLNVARMAGLAPTILRSAAAKAASLEQQATLVDFLHLLSRM